MKKNVSNMRFLEYARRLWRSRQVRALSRRRRQRGEPRIACFPGDNVGDQIIAHGRYEDLLLDLLFDGFLADHRVDFKDQVALDIGANIGNHALFMSPRFARVLAFEPSPIASRLAEASVMMNGFHNVQVFRVALGDEEGLATFFSNQGANLGRSGLSTYLDDSEAVKYEVPVSRGDDFIPPLLDGRRLGLLKLDVEGHECAVLEGMKQLLEAHFPLVLFEYHPGLSPGSDPISRLRAIGYTHFHYVRRNSSGSRNPVQRLLYRMFNGNRLEVLPLDFTPTDRSLDLVVAGRSESP